MGGVRKLVPLGEEQIKFAEEFRKARKASPVMTLEELRAQTPSYRARNLASTPSKPPRRADPEGVKNP
jgi:hypothetical protein